MTDGLFLRAARREHTERTPVWFMRQAGRVLPEYRKVRERWSLLDIVRRPELCAEVTLQPLQRMPLDAAVMFADIMTPLVGIGVDLDIVENVGPVIAAPIVDAAGVEAIRAIDPGTDVPYVLETLRLIRRALPADRAVLGFAGAPFTLASYLIEGKPSREFARTKAFMLGRPALWNDLMTRLSDMTIEYLRAQIEAGADAVQLFDSWIGALGPDDYEAYVRPHVRRIFAALRDTGAPTIHFGTNTAALLGMMKDDGASIIGVDWRVLLDDAWDIIGHDRGIQGNLDPAALLAPADIVMEKAGDVLRRAANRPGHIFNLGHGLLPSTPLETLVRLVDEIQERSARHRAEAAA